MKLCKKIALIWYMIQRYMTWRLSPKKTLQKNIFLFSFQIIVTTKLLLLYCSQEGCWMDHVKHSENQNSLNVIVNNEYFWKEKSVQQNFKKRWNYTIKKENYFSVMITVNKYRKGTIKINICRLLQIITQNFWSVELIFFSFFFLINIFYFLCNLNQ